VHEGRDDIRRAGVAGEGEIRRIAARSAQRETAEREGFVPAIERWGPRNWRGPKIKRSLAPGSFLGRASEGGSVARDDVIVAPKRTATLRPPRKCRRSPVAIIDRDSRVFLDLRNRW